jgi:hypothetical protein
MLQLRYSSLPVLACGVLVALSACNREGQDQMGWARAALERNSAIEIVASDPRTQTFTVRDKNGGALHTLRADEVMAAPQLAAASVTAPPAATTTTAANTDSSARATAASTQATADSASAPAAAANASAQNASAEQADSGDNSASMRTASSALAPQTEAAGGRVLSSGPGYTIKTAAPVAGGNSGTLRDSGITSAPVERRYEPIVCQGARLLHIDNRNLVFSGNAVAAEDGCEIHITNSHITATGVGVSARAANVHIDNSLIEGEQASIDASEGAQVYAASSHFKGLSRRLDSASFHDLGGNIWN